jgi:hypothetical protein
MVPPRPSAARTPEVIGLELPAGFTVRPQATGQLSVTSRQVMLAGNDLVVARAEAIESSYGYGHVRVFRWAPDGTRSAFAPLPVITSPDRGQTERVFDVRAIAATARLVYVSSTVDFSGAYGGTSSEAQIWGSGGTRHWDSMPCSSPDQYDQAVYDADDRGRAALTLDMTGRGSMAVLHAEPEPLYLNFVPPGTEVYAPAAFIVDGLRCKALGRGTVFGFAATGP